MEKENLYETKLNKIEILRGTAEDAEGIQTLVSEASRGMYKLCGWTEEEINTHFNPQVIKEGVGKLKEAIAAFTDTSILFVAKDEGGRVVGCCFANKEEGVNRIEAVYITEDFQGTGLAQKIYGEAYQLLNPDKDTVLDVFSLNSKAINFYKKLGYSETGSKHSDEKYANSKGEKLEITEMKIVARKNKFAKILKIILVVLVVFGGGAYIYLNLQQARVSKQVADTVMNTNQYLGSFYGFSYPLTWDVREINSLLGSTMLFPKSKTDQYMNKKISTTDRVDIDLIENKYMSLSNAETVTLNGKTWYMKKIGMTDGGTENTIVYYRAYNLDKYIMITSGISNRTVVETIATTLLQK